MAYPSFPTCPPLPPLNSIIVCKYKYIAWKEEEGSHKGKRKSRKESIKRKDEGNKNEWGWSKKRKAIVSYFFKVIFYGKVWKWINIVKYKEKGQRKQKWVGVVKNEKGNCILLSLSYFLWKSVKVNQYCMQATIQVS